MAKKVTKRPVKRTNKPPAQPDDPPPNGSAGQTVQLSFPMHVSPEGAYCSRHIDMRLTPEQAATLKRLAMSYEEAGIQPEERKNLGRRPDSKNDAIRVFLNELHERFKEAGSETAED